MKRLALLVLLLWTPLSVHAITTSQYCAEFQEVEMVRLINEYRAQNGLGPVRADQVLGAAAEHHTIDMGQRNVLDHNMADGSSFGDNIRAHGWMLGGYLAEDAAGSYSTAWEILNAWKYSPSHNAALLDPKYVSIGVGRYDDGGVTQARWWWIADMASTGPQKLGIACGGSTSTPTPAPTVPPTATVLPTRTPLPTTPAPSSTPTSVPTATTAPSATSTATATVEPTAPPRICPTRNPHHPYC